METYNPNDHTVAEVLEYLKAHPGELPEVKAAEVGGKNRASITALTPERLAELTAGSDEGGADTPPASPLKVSDTEAQPKDVQTAAATFAAAAEVATPTPPAESYVGYSPERERVGRPDKGLSQRNPAILSGGPVPDPRHGVDDSEALEG